MPTFRVRVCSTVYEWRTVEVESGTQEAAGEGAIDRICNPDLPEIPVEKSDSGGHDVIDQELIAAEPEGLV